MRPRTRRRSALPLTASRRLRPPSHLLNPLIGIPFTRATSQSGPEPNTWPESCYRVFFGEAPQHADAWTAAGVPRRRSAPFPAPSPLDPDPTVQIRFNPSQIDLILVNPWSFCGLALKFFGNHPAVHVSSKVFTNTSFFF
jgi:hypothetical protein